MADYWESHPLQAQMARAWIQGHATDANINHLLRSTGAPASPLHLSGAIAGKAHPSKSRLTKSVGGILAGLQSQGLTPEAAHEALYSELLSAHGNQHRLAHGKKPVGTKIGYATDVTDPIEKLYSEAGDQTAKAVRHLTGNVPDLLQNPKSLGKKQRADIQSRLFSASFARSTAGQLALASHDPRVAGQLARNQMESQVVDEYKFVTSPGGLADAYDAYNQDRIWRQSATAAQKRAAGPALEDPLGKFGYSRTSFGLQPGEDLSGSTIKAAMARKMDAERQSLQGVPQPGTQVYKLIQDLERSGPVGKRLAKVLSVGALSGADIFTAFEELNTGGKLDKTMMARLQTEAKKTSGLGKTISPPTASTPAVYDPGAEGALKR